MVVEKDIDLDNIEKSGVYNGIYFVLGGTIQIFEKHPGELIRSKKLLEIVKKRAEKESLKEIILALSLTTDGENTMRYLSSLLEPIAKQYHLRISTLGRGLSTGIELEYSDVDTIKNALQNRI
jgi:recombination protein RecR